MVVFAPPSSLNCFGGRKEAKYNPLTMIGEAVASSANLALRTEFSYSSERLMKCQRIFLCLALLVVSAWPVWSQNKDDFFETRVRPILATECFSCHTNSQLGGLRLDSREAMLRGGKSGPAIVPGDPEKSLLVIAIRQTGDLKMPKGGKLPQDQIDAIAQWVRTGAVWPSSGKSLSAEKAEIMIDPVRRAFWSFKPLQPTPVPAVKDRRWAKTEIDRFIVS